MSSANVLPSVPPLEDERLYPSLPQENIKMSRQAQTRSNAQNFRLSKISEIEKEIADGSKHYRVVLKKYKKVRQVIHNIVVTLGAVMAVLSGGAFAFSATGVGIVAAIPIASVPAKKVTDTEFAQVAREMQTYHTMKGYLRAESDKKHIATADTSTQMEPVDVEQIRNEIREELRKKLPI